MSLDKNQYEKKKSEEKLKERKYTNFWSFDLILNAFHIVWL